MSADSIRLADEYAALTRDASARHEMWGWLALAVLALAVAGLAAPVLALSRIPGVETLLPWPVEAFEKGLVTHVVFSFVVWFLAVFAALLHLAALQLSGGRPRADGLGTGALAAMAGSFVLLAAPAFLDRGEPSLNNYVPVIIDPLFYAGLTVLAGGVLLAALRLAVNLAAPRRPRDALGAGMAAAAVVYVIALATAAWSWTRLAGETPSHGFNEELFWGAGHVFQFLNAVLLLVAWSLLGGAAIGTRTGSARAYRLGLLLLAAGAVAAPVLAARAPDGTTERELFTDFQYALAPSTVLVAAAVFAAVARARRLRALDWSDPALLCLLLSPLVFGLGGVLGLFVDGADTRTPAHYHGVIAGINVAFMGVVLTVLLPLIGRGVGRRAFVRAQIWLFALGQLIASGGLFLAGGYGAPRKAAGAAQGLADMAAVAGLYLNGVGAAVAVIGGVMFIGTVAWALLRRAAPAP